MEFIIKKLFWVIEHFDKKVGDNTWYRSENKIKTDFLLLWAIIFLSLFKEVRFGEIKRAEKNDYGEQVAFVKPANKYNVVEQRGQEKWAKYGRCKNNRA